jgi:ubiquitin C
MLSFHPATEIQLQVRGVDTVQDVKTRVSEVEGTGSSYLRLLWDTTVLEASKMLSEYDIENGHTLNCLESRVQAKQRPQSKTPTGSVTLKPAEKRPIALKENPEIVAKRAKGSVKQLVAPKMELAENEESVSSSSFTIFVKMGMSGDNTIALVVEESDTIDKIKARIQYKEDIPVKELKIIIGDEVADGQLTLKAIGVQKYDELTAIIDKSFSLKIHRDYHSEPIVIQALDTFTVDDIKALIQDKTNISVEKQHLHVWKSRGAHPGYEMTMWTMDDHSISAYDDKLFLFVDP